MKHTTSLPIQTFPITINESPLMINHKRCSQYKKTQNPTQIAHNPFESANEWIYWVPQAFLDLYPSLIDSILEIAMIHEKIFTKEHTLTIASAKIPLTICNFSV